MPARRTSPRLAAVLAESIPTVVLVGVCFAFFLGIVRLSFPEGTGLRGMIRSGDPTSWSGDADPNLETVGIRRAEAARLTRLVRKVKDKPADDIAWHDARPGMPLTMRHSVQTLAQSSATIAFDDETSLVLGENSLIVLRNFDGEEDGSDRQATLVVFGGELRATMGGGQAGTRLAVETPKGVAKLASASAEEPARFRVEVRPDSSASVAVYDGSADVRVGDRTVRVEANQAVDLDETGARAPRALPPPPALGWPAHGTRVAFRGAAPELRFR
ncbi:MAG TPA: FecR domain-containing protein, partial [bacterium]|nr:FecR domain-containing protein [bacterium]